MFDFASFLKTLPNKPGVYQMLDKDHQVLYVGKAKNLKNRVSSYFCGEKDVKTSSLLQQVASIEIIITEDENAALLLEGNLIKTLRPHYNILFKDDKSFPYLFLSAEEFPRLSIHRGAKDKKGKYFGPFPNAYAVRATFYLLQRIFKLRTCTDSFFNTRTRPCMQCQIKRCSGPCGGSIDKATYARNVEMVEQFLCKKNNVINQRLAELMEEAAASQQYETAAMFRDQIIALRKLQTDQYIVQEKGDIDCVAVLCEGNYCCVNVLFVRNGLVIGDKTFFPEQSAVAKPEEVLTTFLTQHYLDAAVKELLPQKILLNIELSERVLIEATLTQEHACKVKVVHNVRGTQKRLLQMAEVNAQHALQNRTSKENNYFKNLVKFKEVFQLAKVPQRIECFDVSHTMGEATVAACVVFNEKGAVKSNYRRFNIKTAAASDDYAALREALLRYYQKTTITPEVVIIDGGKGQLKIAKEVLQQFNFNDALILGIAKGVSRKPGLEEIYLVNQDAPITFNATSPALHFLQYIRDTAHHFAISGHRRKLAATRKHSLLENIVGVGARKRAELLKYFGGLQELKCASSEDIAKVKGINKKLAARIYEYLHSP